MHASLKQHHIEEKDMWDKADNITLQTTEVELADIVGKIGIAFAIRVAIDSGLGAGHWYKCKNCQTPFVIGDCGGAMELSQCVGCKKPIRGGGHMSNDNTAIPPGRILGSEMAFMWDDGIGGGGMHRMYE